MNSFQWFFRLANKMNIFKGFSRDSLLTFGVIMGKMTYFNKITEKYRYFQPKALLFSVFHSNLVHFHKMIIFKRELASDFKGTLLFSVTI